jgi:hypothetical protein
MRRSCDAICDGAQCDGFVSGCRLIIRLIFHTLQEISWRGCWRLHFLSSVVRSIFIIIVDCCFLLLAPILLLNLEGCSTISTLLLKESRELESSNTTSNSFVRMIVSAK